MAKEFNSGTGGKAVGEATVLKTYFGVRPGENTQQFMGELRQLTPEAKTELAEGAAKLLGWPEVTAS